MSVIIPPNSISQYHTQVVGAKADDPDPMTSNLATTRIAIENLHLQSNIDVLKSDLVCLYERRKPRMLKREQKKKNNEIENNFEEKE